MFLTWSILIKAHVVSSSAWSYIKSQRNDQTSIPVLQIDGMLVDDHYSKAKLFHNYFSSVFTKKMTAKLREVLMLLIYLLAVGV